MDRVLFTFLWGCLVGGTFLFAMTWWWMSRKNHELQGFLQQKANELLRMHGHYQTQMDELRYTLGEQISRTTAWKKHADAKQKLLEYMGVEPHTGEKSPWAVVHRGRSQDILHHLRMTIDADTVVLASRAGWLMMHSGGTQAEGVQLAAFASLVHRHAASLRSALGGEIRRFNQLSDTTGKHVYVLPHEHGYLSLQAGPILPRQVIHPAILQLAGLPEAPEQPPAQPTLLEIPALLGTQLDELQEPLRGWFRRWGPVHLAIIDPSGECLATTSSDALLLSSLHAIFDQLVLRAWRDELDLEQLEWNAYGSASQTIHFCPLENSPQALGLIVWSELPIHEKALLTLRSTLRWKLVHNDAPSLVAVG